MTKLESPTQFDDKPSASNHFAWIRTRLGLERTFMAWIRTSVSLIGFGFTIVQFFQHMQGMNTGLHKMRPEAPRDLGLALIATGIGALAISARQYRMMLRYLRSDGFKAIAIVESAPKSTPVFFTAMVIIAIGIFAFVTVFFRFM